MQVINLTHEPSTRIGIIGAGCTGLTAAEELRDLGYKHITILDVKNRIGGKTYSVKYADTTAQARGIYEGGTVWILPSPLYTKYNKRYGISTAYRVMPRVQVIDLATGRVSSPFLIETKYSLFSRLWQLTTFFWELRKHTRYDSPGFVNPIYQAMSEPSPQWFTKRGLGFIREALIPIANAAQFGHIEEEVSIAYVIRLLALLNRCNPIKKLVLNMPQLQEGNQELWNRVAATHNLFLGQSIERIYRDKTIFVQTSSGQWEFDHLIWTAPVDDFLRVADASSEETDIFSRVRTIKRAVVTCKAEGLPQGIFYFVKNTLNHSVPTGYPFVIYEVDIGSKIYNFYPFMDETTTIKELECNVADLVQKLGGTQIKFLGQPLIWKWFSHFSPQDIGEGIYKRLETLQGCQNTYFANELNAGVSVPYGMEYAANLVQHFFIQGYATQN
ncbi:MAG: NAD(P)-binding protein [Trichormus sp. ATA11-4-KO1]|jgi:hypothetical protein|nr:NAD(P)-binding protein [Trichormus sp. ATA11-4-KO1]